MLCYKGLSCITANYFYITSLSCYTGWKIFGNVIQHLILCSLFICSHKALFFMAYDRKLPLNVKNVNCIYKVFCNPLSLWCVCLFTNVNISYFFSLVMVGNHNSKTKSCHNCCHCSWTLKYLKSIFHLLVSICCCECSLRHSECTEGMLVGFAAHSSVQ